VNNIKHKIEISEFLTTATMVVFFILFLSKSSCSCEKKKWRENYSFRILLINKAVSTKFLFVRNKNLNNLETFLFFFFYKLELSKVESMGMWIEEN